MIDVSSTHLFNKYFRIAQPRTFLWNGEEKLNKTHQVPDILVGGEKGETSLTHHKTDNFTLMYKTQCSERGWP